MKNLFKEFTMPENRSGKKQSSTDVMNPVPPLKTSVKRRGVRKVKRSTPEKHTEAERLRKAASPPFSTYDPAGVA